MYITARLLYYFTLYYTFKNMLFLKLPAGVSYEEAIRRAGGREFLYQHMRGGHWHTVKYGVERKLEKVMWFDETVVRPDLPPKPVIN